MRRPALLLVLLVAALSAPPGLAEGAPVSVLGANGTLFSLHAGAVSDLLPQGPDDDRQTPVMVLEVRGTDGQRVRHLVPGTEGDDIESSLSLLTDDASGRVYLLWESWYGIAQSRLQLIGLTDDGWTEIIEISASPYVRKNSTDLALTRDLVEDEENGQTVTRQRTVLHVAWVEEAENGGSLPVYVPLLLLDGSYLAAGERTDLSSLLAPRAVIGPRPSEALRAALSVRAGNDGASVIVAFTDDETHTVAAVQVEVVPRELSAMADDLERFILESGEDPREDPAALQRLSDGARPHLIDFGYRIQPALLPHLASRAAAFIAEQDASLGLAAIATASRQHLIDHGAQLDRSGVRRVVADARPHLIDFGARGDDPPERRRAVARHDLRLTVASSRPAPETPERPTQLLASPKGGELMLWWQSAAGDAIQYVDSEGGGWSAVNSLAIGEALPVTSALQLLGERVDAR
jgi:hypothetical protein